MIMLILGALRARWTRAVPLLLLSMAAVASAVVGPAYLRGVDRAVIEHQVAGASPAERTVTISASTSRNSSGLDIGRIGSALVDIPGFSTIFAIDLDVLGIDRSHATPDGLAYRQGVCDHLTIVAGRCLVGGGEVVVGEHTAARDRLAPGDTLPIAFARFDDSRKIWTPGGRQLTVTVVGVYRVPDRTSLFWGTHAYFPMNSAGEQVEPVFTQRTTVRALDHPSEQDTVEVVSGPDAFAPDRLGPLRGEVHDATEQLGALGDDITVGTSIPDLLDRVDAGQRQAGQLVPVVEVPLVILAWFVIFLAVGHGTAARRRELGLLALRGTRPTLRWLLAGGEYLIPVAIGTAAGYPLGLFVASLASHARLGEPAAGGGLGWYAVAAGAGAGLAALLAQRRELFGPVAGMLRRIPAGAGRWRSAAAEAVVVVLAIAATVSLRGSGGQLTGVGMLVPALVIAAIALLTARAVIPLATRLGRLALRRGRLGAALAALQLGRRPGAQRVFVLLVAAIAVLGFGTAASGTAARARADRAEIASGAARVLTVSPVTRTKLLVATHAVDPGGRYAMAVATILDGAPGEPTKLAVDSSRLAAVAAWRPDYGGPSPAELGRLLSPALPAPVVVTGDRIELDVGVVLLPSNPQLDLTVVLAPLDGAPASVLTLGPLAAGEQTLRGGIGCPAGCRLVGFAVTKPDGGSFLATVTLHELRVGSGADAAPATVAIPPARFAAAGDWRASASGRAALSGAANGLQVDLRVEVGGSVDRAWVSPADRPATLPVAATATLPGDAKLTGLDGRQAPVHQVAKLDGLPRLGRAGALVDLTVADRMATDAGTADEEIWLNSAAPADVVQRLKAQGLTVTGDSGIAPLRAGLDAQGPALALWFYLVAALLAMLLAAGGLWLASAVDAQPGAADLRALRVQGVPRGVTGRAGLLGYLMVVAAALVVGPLAAAVAWLVAGGSLPVAGEISVWPVPRWPRPAAVLWPWAAAAATLVAVALIAAAGLRGKLKESSE
jgi:putative ABC transport system permease protein